jgi:hypothetical protein
VCPLEGAEWYPQRITTNQINNIFNVCRAAGSQPQHRQFKALMTVIAPSIATNAAPATFSESSPAITGRAPSLRRAEPPPATPPPPPPRLLSRGGCHNRWYSLANCDHRDSITRRTCTAAARGTSPSPMAAAAARSEALPEKRAHHTPQLLLAPPSPARLVLPLLDATHPGAGSVPTPAGAPPSSLHSAAAAMAAMAAATGATVVVIVIVVAVVIVVAFVVGAAAASAPGG